MSSLFYSSVLYLKRCKNLTKIDKYIVEILGSLKIPLLRMWSIVTGIDNVIQCTMYSIVHVVLVNVICNSQYYIRGHP